MDLTFYGATGTVTGSKSLLDIDGLRILVDCGLFQGFKTLRERNWAPLPFDPASLDAVLLTHAHIDHSGCLPLLTRHGFRGTIWTSAASADLCDILLQDTAHLQEEEARYRNRHKATRHDPAEPLYTVRDAEACLKHIKAVSANLEQFTGQRSTQQLPESLNQSLKQLQETLQTYDAGSQTNQELRQSVQSLNQLMGELQPLVHSLNEQPSSLIFDRSRPQDPEPKRGK